MASPNSIPVRFTPRGLADAYDATDVFAGACRQLTNLVFDQSNPEIVIARPGVSTPLTSFAGFITPGFISIQVTIGTLVYGMVATGLTATYDEPFCYDLVNGVFIAITGPTAGNTEGRPLSPATFGAWTPPTMAVIGVKLIITHPGYSGGGSNFFGVIDISNPAFPTYVTQNTITHVLPSVPTSVANLGNRAYFACGNTVYYSDVLVPTTMTNAGQSLTLGDTTPILALSGLPIQTSTAGVLSALLVFKGAQIWQITGDAAITGSLSENYLSLTVGCMAPRSIVPTPLGTFFAGPDSCYLVSPFGAVLPVTNQLGTFGAMPDIRQPFGYATQPTRMAAAFAGNIYRVCIPTIIDGVESTYDYWFDTRKNRWNGPHTFIYDCASSVGTYFILSGAGTPAMLFRGDPFPNTNTLYTDNSVAYGIELHSSDFPKKDEMSMKQVIESTIELSSAGTAATYTIQVYAELGTLMTPAFVITAASGGIWGSNNWGDGSVWSGATNRPKTYPANWSGPLVFNKMSIDATAAAGKSIAIGTFYARTQKLGYTLQQR